MERDLIEQRDSKVYHTISKLARLSTTKLDASLDRLVIENCEIREENELLMSRLNHQSVKLEKATAKIQDLQEKEKKYKETTAKLKNEISKWILKLADKNRLFEIASGEHLVTQMQLNLLREQKEDM